ncbi:MAG: hypothetical protein Q7S84_01820 [bacterium]|nr:hypothetical protein [bacterium]
MRVSTKRILSIGAALLFFLGALMVYLSLIREQADAITEVRSRVASQQALLKNQQQIVNQVQNLIERFQNVGQLKSTISLAMPNGVESIGALRQVEAISRASNVLLTAVDFKASLVRLTTKQQSDATDLLKKLGNLKVTMSVVGSYADLKRFVGQLETSARVANVSQLKFVPSASAEAPAKLTLTADMYYQE